MKDQLISFDDTETAFRSKTDAELKRAYWLFKLLSLNWLVRISPPFIRFALFIHLPIKGLIRRTVYRQFCGGETISDCTQTVEKLAEYHIGTILDYSVEGKESVEDFENALDETLASIDRAKDDASIPFCVFKPTGFARFALLEKKNSQEKLNADEASEFAEFVSRVEKICLSAFEKGVPVFIDAEESWIQDVVDELATNLMKKYNREKVIIYNTIQMYRTGRIHYLEKNLAEAAASGFIPGFKIVRGAYMEKERKRASRLGLPSPIQPDKSATDRDYNLAIEIALNNIDRLSLCAGTHNEKSSLLLVELMRKKHLANNHHHIWFSQLYGMSDHISYNLAMQGYNVCKYVPYGPVEDVLPYLVRRAQENTSVAGQTSRELSLLQTELKRRKKS